MRTSPVSSIYSPAWKAELFAANRGQGSPLVVDRRLPAGGATSAWRDLRHRGL